MPNPSDDIEELTLFSPFIVGICPPIPFSSSLDDSFSSDNPRRYCYGERDYPHPNVLLATEPNIEGPVPAGVTFQRAVQFFWLNNDNLFGRKHSCLDIDWDCTGRLKQIRLFDIVAERANERILWDRDLPLRPLRDNDCLPSSSVTGAFISGSQTRHPRTIVSDATFGDQAWGTPENAGASDDAYASTTLGAFATTSEHLKATDYDFSVPINAVNIVVTLHVERNSVVADRIKDERVRCVINDVIGATDHSSPDNWPASDATQDYDLTDDMPTAVQINNPGFGAALAAVRVASSAPQARVDDMSITVTWDEPVESSSDAEDVLIDLRVMTIVGTYSEVSSESRSTFLTGHPSSDSEDTVECWNEYASMQCFTYSLPPTLTNEINELALVFSSNGKLKKVYSGGKLRCERHKCLWDRDWKWKNEEASSDLSSGPDGVFTASTDEIDEPPGVIIPVLQYQTDSGNVPYAPTDTFGVWLLHFDSCGNYIKACLYAVLCGCVPSGEPSGDGFQCPCASAKCFELTENSGSGLDASSAPDCFATIHYQPPLVVITTCFEGGATAKEECEHAEGECEFVITELGCPNGPGCLYELAGDMCTPPSSSPP